MYAIEINNLVKSYKEKNALNGLNMKVPVGAIYGFIGENGSGKSTTEKIICGLIHKTSGDIKLFGSDIDDVDIRYNMGSLIEAPGCYPNYSVWNNLILHALNLGIKNKEDEVRKLLTLVRMEGAASNKYKNCSLGMKQRIGIAMSLMTNPRILVLDEPINALDVDGMRIVREVLVDLASKGVTILISSHILGELEKIATHYGIIRHGKMIKEMTASELDRDLRSYVAIKVKNIDNTKSVLLKKYNNVVIDEGDYIRIYDASSSSDISSYLYENNIIIEEITTNKIGLMEYYNDLMMEDNNE